MDEFDSSFPEFAKEAVHTAPILALLQDPGNSGAEKTEVCSIHTNKDATSRNQKEAIKEAGIDTKEIVFWNFFASVGHTSAQRKPDSDSR